MRGGEELSGSVVGGVIKKAVETNQG